MTRMIERWFPCAEVSAASYRGWGSGNSEKNLFPWFAARPLAQAKAAVLTSLLPWPESEPEQRTLQALVRDAMKGHDAKWDEVTAELEKANPGGASLLDLFSGRAMIPLEAARLGIASYGIDYSPVATLAGSLLADYPLRDWSSEPALLFNSETLEIGRPRLMVDVEHVLNEVGRRYEASMQEFYPTVEGVQPWGYLWATTLPCQECGHRFPLTGSLALRPAQPSRNDAGQSYRIEVDRRHGTYRAVVHSGPPIGQPTLVQVVRAGKKMIGKSAVCSFCEHVHPKALHARLASEGQGRDAVLVTGEIDARVGKTYREPTELEIAGALAAQNALEGEPDFAAGLPAVPNEPIPEGNSDTIRASVYGAKTYGDLCNARQTLAFVRLARVISDLGQELTARHGVSPVYAQALTGYASAVLVRKFRRATRGCTLDPSRQGVHDIFQNESTVGFSYDYFEAGLGGGPGTWPSLASSTVSTLKNLMASRGGPAIIERGTAVSLPFPDGSMSAVVTDPPYDEMIAYSDASDLFYVWLKRALFATHPSLAFTADPNGVQEKDEEIIVKRFRAKKTAKVLDHRTRAFYDAMIARAFAEARRVVQADGVVTIVFGHGDPEVWHRLLGAITSAGLVLTGSWPAKTESGGSAGSANIVTTLTMSCRPAPANRQPGRANLVEAEVKRVVKARVQMWEAAGLAPTDQLMASAGPAMEVVGRYSKVVDNLGEPVEPDRYLLVARRAIEEAASIEVDHLPLETFDARTRFALSWTRLYGRGIAPKSEARWQALASDLDLNALKGVLGEADKGVRLSPASGYKGETSAISAVIDVAMAMAKAWPEGLDAVGEVLAASQRSLDDPYLWAAMGFLSSKLPEADPDAVAWTGLVRAKRGIGAATREVVTNKKRADEDADGRVRQGNLFEQLDVKVEGQLDLTDEGEGQ